MNSLSPAANNSSSLSLVTIPDETAMQQFKTVESLKVFQPLRRGKWSTDEQNYAELLIQYFLAGVVPDCSDGTTLRAFLSAKLHCAPMRITKKFAGATLGKSIFYRTGHLEESELHRLCRLETLFVRSEETLSAEAVFFAMRSTQQQQQQQRQRSNGRGDDAVPNVSPKTNDFARTASTSSFIAAEDEPAVRPKAITLTKLGSTAYLSQDALDSSAAAPAATSSLSSLSSSSSLGAAAGQQQKKNKDADDGVVAARAKAAANAAVSDREENAPASSTWAARVAERAAIVTAARRDAELRAARRKLSSAAAAAEADQKATPQSLPKNNNNRVSPSQEESPSALPPISERGTKRLRADNDRRASPEAPSDEPELYSELYGWVPPNLGVTASPDEISRHLGLRAGAGGGGDQGRSDGEERSRRSDAAGDNDDQQRGEDRDGGGEKDHESDESDDDDDDSKENEECRQISLLKSLLPNTPNYRNRSAAPDADLPNSALDSSAKPTTRNALEVPSGASPFLGLSYRKLLVGADASADQDPSS